jgi:hypothetical protein
MAVLRIPGQELDNLMRDINRQVEKIEFEFGVTKNLIIILQKAHEKTKTDQNRNSGRSDSLGAAGTEQEN